MPGADPDQNPSGLLAVEAVAADLGVTSRTVREYVARGDLPAYRIAGSRLLRFRRADVDALLIRVDQGPAAVPATQEVGNGGSE